jgi:hypothetical protein
MVYELVIIINFMKIAWHYNYLPLIKYLWLMLSSGIN